MVDQLGVERQRLTPFFTLSARREFKNTLIPPDRLSAWMAILPPKYRVLADITPGYLSFGGIGKHLSGYVFTYSLGQVVLQLLALKDVARPGPGAIHEIDYAIVPTKNSWDDLAVQIWPIKTRVSWPPRLHLLPQGGRSGYEFLANRFFRLPPAV